MIVLLSDLAQAAILGVCIVVASAVCYGWARLMERLAGSGCTCRKGAWDPECPVHGRRAAGEEPFPGAWPPW